MKSAHKASSRLSEKALIRRGLKDPEVRAFVKVVGALLLLPSDRARRQTLDFVADTLAEENPA